MIRVHHVLLVVALLVLTACSGMGVKSSNLSQSAATDLDLFPEVVMFLVDGERNCSAVMIETNIALTSAHCIVDYGQMSLKTSTGVESYVIKYEAHPLFTEPSWSNDIAVVMVEDDLIESHERPFIWTAAITSSDFASVVVAVGWSGGQQNIYESWLLSVIEQDIILFLADPGHLWFGDSGGGTYIIRDQMLWLTGVNTLVFSSRSTRQPLASGSTSIAQHLSWIYSVTDEWDME